MSALTGWIESRERFEDDSKVVNRTELKAGNKKDFIKAVQKVLAVESYIDFVHRWVLYAEHLGGYQTIWRTDLEVGSSYRGIWAYRLRLDKHHKPRIKGRPYKARGPKYTPPLSRED